MHWHTLVPALLAALATAKPLIPTPCTNHSISWNSTAWNHTRPSFNNSSKPNPPSNSTLVTSLLTADSTASRFRRLQQAINDGTASAVFDYNPLSNPVQNTTGGEAIISSRDTFPLVTDLGISGSMYFFAPCGLDTPHIHPRASEIFTVSTNSTIRVGFVLEDGFSNQLNSTLTQYQGTAFPQGSIHWQQNLECEPAVAIGALNSDDPGTSSLAQNFLLDTDEDIVQATLGYPVQITADNFASLRSSIHPSFVSGIEECYQRCGIPC